jgi:hypothetical protein
VTKKFEIIVDKFIMIKIIVKNKKDKKLLSNPRGLKSSKV